ncbi:MAG: ABC transporter permease [Planctomycetota bacterium]|jgi:putative ABC transport system permease protein
MTTLISDIKYALRQLFKQPTCGLMIIGILALGIAGSVTIFSLFNELFLRPFPVPHSERLVDLDERAPQWNLEYTGVCPADFYSWRKYNTTFDCMAVYQDQGHNLALAGEARRIDALKVTHDYFEVVGNRPIIGRLFTAKDDDPNAPRVVLLSERLWRERFGRDQSVLGQSILLDNQPYTVIGVLGADAVFPVRPDLWTPMAMDLENSHGGWYLRCLGRRKAGVTLAQARDDITRIHRGLIDRRPVNKITSPRLDPARDRMYGQAMPVMRLLGVAVACVLLIACCNVSGILLARGATRTKEMAIRAALGASRFAVVRQILTENLLLCSIGVILGALLGRWGLQGLLFLISHNVAPWMSFDLDYRFLIFGISLVLATTLISGLLPALRCSAKLHLQESLQSSGRCGTVSRSHQRSLHAVVAGEVALACISLIIAGLLIRAFHRLQSMDPGFVTHGILTYSIDLPGEQYPTPEQRQTLFEQHLERVTALPGVRYAAVTNFPPLSGHWGNFIHVEEKPLGPDEQNPVILTRVVSPDYFQTMGIQVQAGRVFTGQDLGPDSEATVIVNESLVRHFWPNENPVGKRIAMNQRKNWMRIIGVTRDVKHYGFDQAMRPGIYLPYAREHRGGAMTVVVRCAGDPLALVAPIRERVHHVDATLPVFGVRSMAERIRRHDSMWVRCIYSWLFGIFAAVAALLAAGGIYGIITFAVSQRTQEMGIRMALGARPGQLVGQVLQRAAVLIGIGLAVGIACALVASYLLSGFLFGVSPVDPLTYASVSLLLITVTLLASYVPARRAAKIDPMEALRYE